MFPPRWQLSQYGITQVPDHPPYNQSRAHTATLILSRSQTRVTAAAMSLSHWLLSGWKPSSVGGPSWDLHFRLFPHSKWTGRNSEEITRFIAQIPKCCRRSNGAWASSLNHLLVRTSSEPRYFNVPWHSHVTGEKTLHAEAGTSINYHPRNHKWIY